MTRVGYEQQISKETFPVAILRRTQIGQSASGLDYDTLRGAAHGRLLVAEADLACTGDTDQESETQSRAEPQSYL